MLPASLAQRWRAEGYLCKLCILQTSSLNGGCKASLDIHRAACQDRPCWVPTLWALHFRLFLMGMPDACKCGPADKIMPSLVCFGADAGGAGGHGSGHVRRQLQPAARPALAWGMMQTNSG